VADASADQPQVSKIGDLRKQSIDDLIHEVQERLGVLFDESTIIRKRRSVGAQTDRKTWVRVEVRPRTKIATQHQINNGLEAAALLDGIAKPAWFRAATWYDGSSDAFFRADEIELVTGTNARPIGYPLHEPQLSSDWWDTFNKSLDNLAAQHITRVATPDTQLITQGLVTETIERAFPGQVDTAFGDAEWVPAHADLNWSNLTAPDCWFLDWEDVGVAPRGLDAATLWMTSLMVPTLAEKVRCERRADLETRSGKLMALFYCAKALNDSHFASDPVYEPTARNAAALVSELRRQ
jgi:hypothetical protein